MPSLAKILAASLLKGIEGGGNVYSKYAIDKLVKEPTNLQREYEYIKTLPSEDQATLQNLKGAGTYGWQPGTTGPAKITPPREGRSETSDERYVRLTNQANIKGPRSLSPGDAEWLASEHRQRNKGAEYE